ncbi:hypothetical protein C8F01DRAFT_1375399 [Mycena amicta]|nr:hypothetical protein C8F01DRAFT_1375399 [Mycena amicta]
MLPPPSLRPSSCHHLALESFGAFDYARCHYESARCFVRRLNRSRMLPAASPPDSRLRMRLRANVDATLFHIFTLDGRMWAMKVWGSSYECYDFATSTTIDSAVIIDVSRSANHNPVDWRYANCEGCDSPPLTEERIWGQSGQVFETKQAQRSPNWYQAFPSQLSYDVRPLSAHGLSKRLGRFVAGTCLRRSILPTLLTFIHDSSRHAPMLLGCSTRSAGGERRVEASMVVRRLFCFPGS